MKSIFDKATTDELIRRINTLNEQSKAQWGKMTIYQMLKHCTLWEEWIMGGKTYKRSLLGLVFGRIALKNAIKDETPMMRNAVSLPEFRIKEKDGDVLAEKAKWIALVKEHEQFSNPGFVHFFFGKMTKEQIGYFAYKHTDHHLRQFGS